LKGCDNVNILTIEGRSRKQYFDNSIGRLGRIKLIFNGWLEAGFLPTVKISTNSIWGTEHLPKSPMPLEVIAVGVLVAQLQQSQGIY
jgi:hypothetical protein